MIEVEPPPAPAEPPLPTEQETNNLNVENFGVGRASSSSPTKAPLDRSSSLSSATARRKNGASSDGTGGVVGALASAMVDTAHGMIKGIQERLEGRVQNRIGHALHQRIRSAILKNVELEKKGERKVPFRVMVVVPLHPNGRFLHSTECMAVMNAQFNCIGRGDRSLLGRLALEFPYVDLSDYILFTSLRAHGELASGLPVSDQVYVHSKCLIVDDRVAIVGSSNLNDRSMCGDRDSEIAVRVTEAMHITPSTMDGDHYAVAQFAHTLRVKLWRDHMGMLPLGDSK